MAASVHITRIIVVLIIEQSSPLLLLVGIQKSGAFSYFNLIRVLINLDESSAFNELRRSSLLIAHSVVNHRPA